MLCRTCQTLNSDKASRCQNCGTALPKENPGPTFSRIPSGFSPTNQPVSSISPGGFRLVYLVPLATAVVTVGVAELWLRGLGKPSMVLGFPFIGLFVVLFFLAALVGDFKVLDVCDKLNNRITSRADLERLKPAISHNMKIAMTSLCLLVTVIGVMMLYSRMSPATIASQVIGLTCYFPPAVLYLVIFGLWQSPRKRVKRLHLVTDDPEVARLHHQWIKQWGQARWTLPS